MVLGHELARNFGLNAGNKTRLMGREFAVAKVNPERGNKDDITVWISLPEAQELLAKPGLINGILALDCTCDTLDRLGRIRPEIAGILPDTQVIEYASQALTRAEATGQELSAKLQSFQSVADGRSDELAKATGDRERLLDELRNLREQNVRMRGELEGTRTLAREKKFFLVLSKASPRGKWRRVCLVWCIVGRTESI